MPECLAASAAFFSVVYLWDFPKIRAFIFSQYDLVFFPHCHLFTLNCLFWSYFTMTFFKHEPCKMWAPKFVARGGNWFSGG